MPTREGPLREYAQQRLLFHLILLARTIRSKPGLGGNNPVIHSLSKGEYVLQHAILQICTAGALAEHCRTGETPHTAPFMNVNRIESSSPSNLKYIPRLSRGLPLQHPLHPSSVLARLKTTPLHKNRMDIKLTGSVQSCWQAWRRKRKGKIKRRCMSLEKPSIQFRRFIQSGTPAVCQMARKLKIYNSHSRVACFLSQIDAKLLLFI